MNNRIIHILQERDYHYDGKLYSGNTIVPPTNNRAEFLAVCQLMAALIEVRIEGTVVILCDSRLVVRTILRRYNPTKNLDLVEIAMTLFNQLQDTCTVKLVEIRSHKRQPAKELKLSRFAWIGNWYVDKIAKHACHGTSWPPGTVDLRLGSIYLKSPYEE